MFLKDFKKYPQAVQDRYSELQDPRHKEVAKQEKVNQIINAAVTKNVTYKDRAKPDSLVFAHIVTICERSFKSSKSIGISKTMMLAKCNSSKELMNEGIERGDIWKEVDDKDGKEYWYTEEKVRGEEESRNEAKEGRKSWKLKDKEYEEAIDDLNKSFPWLGFGNEKLQAGDHTSPATDRAMQKLQDAYDSLTHQVLLIKKATRQILDLSAPTPTLLAMATKARNIIEDMKGPIGKFEDLIMRPRSELKDAQVKTLVNETHPGFLQITQIHKELRGVVKISGADAANKKRSAGASQYYFLLLLSSQYYKWSVRVIFSETATNSQ